MRTAKEPQRTVFVKCPQCLKNLDTYHERRPLFASSPIRVQTSVVCCNACAQAD